MRVLTQFARIRGQGRQFYANGPAGITLAVVLWRLPLNCSMTGADSSSGALAFYSHFQCRFMTLLLFAPRNTALFLTYKTLHTSNVNVISGSEMSWNATIAVLAAHSNFVSCVAFSADSSRLASASWDCKIRLWDSRTGHHLSTLVGHSDGVNSVTFLGHDTRLASASFDRTIRLWDSRTGHHTSTLIGHSGAVWSVTSSVDGLRLASGSSDKTVRIWDGRTGDHIATLEGHSSFVNSLAFSSDGSILASASHDNTVRLWDGRTGYHITTIKGLSKRVNAIAFSHNGSTLASASNDGTVQLWDGGTGRHITTEVKMRRHITFKKTSRHLSNLYTGRHFTIQDRSQLVWSVAFSYNDSKLASGSHDIQLWHGKTGARIATLESYSSRVGSITFSLDGSSITSASNISKVPSWVAEVGTGWHRLAQVETPANPPTHSTGPPLL